MISSSSWSRKLYLRWSIQLGGLLLFFLFAFILFVFSDECIYITLCCLWLVDEDDWFGLTQNHNKGETIDLCGGCPFFFLFLFYFPNSLVFLDVLDLVIWPGYFFFSPLFFFSPMKSGWQREEGFFLRKVTGKKEEEFRPRPFFFFIYI